MWEKYGLFKMLGVETVIEYGASIKVIDYNEGITGGFCGWDDRTQEVINDKLDLIDISGMPN